MAEIILFGLSADMPHVGHINWVKNLQNMFPNHAIVLMPCSANPLGKKDEDGHIIYPSNGYLRWEMLYNYYKNSGIIVSQYEVAINTPSTTIKTIKYLIQTPIEEIKAQRGYQINNTSQSKIINNITLALGNELFNELPLWHDWQDILEVCNIILIKRASYPQIIPSNINNKELKKIFMNKSQNGSLIQMNGPQINISSRELKKLLRNGTDDIKLQEFIPLSILKYIRNNQAEFSKSYYQKPLAREIFDIAMRDYHLKLTQFSNNRKKYFSAFVADLRNIEDISNWDRLGYKITNSRITVNLNLANHNKIHQIISNYLKNDNNPWFYVKSPIIPIITPYEFNANFKLLGSFGENETVDIILFIKDSENNLKILTINRADDQKSLALPGGFNESNIIDSIFDELLEECFSNKLFANDSISKKILENTIIDKNNLIKISEKYIPNSSLAILDTKKIINSVLNQLKNDKNKTSKFKCQLYKNILPQHFNKFKKYILNNAKLSPKEINVLDERNTNFAWIATTTLRALLNETEFQNTLHECGLEISGGEDASSANIISVIDFCKPTTEPYSSHKNIVLKNLAKYIEESAINLNMEYLDKL